MNRRYGARGPEWTRKSHVYFELPGDYVRKIADRDAVQVHLPQQYFWRVAWCCIRSALTIAVRPSLRSPV